tara:strand:+ start:115 stop:765 length:651 start_codon:yes stop_codon:yes gene_type:complete
MHIKQNTIYEYIADQLPDDLQNKLLKKAKETSDPLNVVKYIHAVCMSVCNLTEQKTITPRLLPMIVKNVEKSCTRKIFVGGCKDCGKWKMKRGMGGGGEGVMPLSFYGMPEDMYQPVDAYAKDVLGVDFEKGILRPEIGPGDDQGSQSGGSSCIAKHHKLVNMIARMLSKHCKGHNKVLSKQVKYYMSVYIYMKIDCMINRVKKEKSLSKGVYLIS